MALSPWLGVGYLGIQGLKLADRERLRKEANDEISTEIRIIDQKIENLKQHNYYNGDSDPNKEKKMYQLMRQRQKLVQMLTDANKRKFDTSRSVY
jgi:NADH:ubiquinone oxidoreductase subunit D